MSEYKNHFGYKTDEILEDLKKRLKGRFNCQTKIDGDGPVQELTEDVSYRIHIYNQKSIGRFNFHITPNFFFTDQYTFPRVATSYIEGVNKIAEDMTFIRETYKEVPQG